MPDLEPQVEPAFSGIDGGRPGQILLEAKVDSTARGPGAGGLIPEPAFSVMDTKLISSMVQRQNPEQDISPCLLLQEVHEGMSPLTEH